MKFLRDVKYWFKKFSFLRIYNTPFQKPRVIFYFGKIRHGTPIFFPRKWVKDKEKPGYYKAITRKIGFDLVGLGWKTKWTETDYRFEWDPIWSFVFFKWQICIKFTHNYHYHYWESWLYYDRETEKTKTKQERLEQCMKDFPLDYIEYSGGQSSKINYYPLILKSKWLKRK